MIWRIISIFLVVLALSGCAQEFTKKSKDSGGRTSYYTQARTANEPKFNAVSYFTGTPRIERAYRDNSAMVSEYVNVSGKRIVAIEHHQTLWYSSASTLRIQERSRFASWLAKAGMTHLENRIRVIRDRSIPGLVAEDGRCVAATFGKRLKSGGIYDNDTGLPDTYVYLASCSGMNISVDEFVQRFDFATAADVATYRMSLSQAGKSSTGSTSSGESTRPIVVTWEGVGQSMPGEVRFAAGDLYRLTVQLPNAGAKCGGTFEPKDEQRGLWQATCDNGLSVQGRYWASGSDNGYRGEGFDGRGRQVSFTVNRR